LEDDAKSANKFTQIVCDEGSEQGLQESMSATSVCRDRLTPTISSGGDDCCIRWLREHCERQHDFARRYMYIHRTKCVNAYSSIAIDRRDVISWKVLFEPQSLERADQNRGKIRYANSMPARRVLAPDKVHMSLLAVSAFAFPSGRLHLRFRDTYT
jgi:hypothetical protein